MTDYERGRADERAAVVEYMNNGCHPILANALALRDKGELWDARVETAKGQGISKMSGEIWNGAHLEAGSSEGG